MSNKWIDATKELPPYNMNVLVYTNYNQIGISCVDGSGYFDEHLCEANMYNCDNDERIIFWRHLPPPPKNKAIPKELRHTRDLEITKP